MPTYEYVCQKCGHHFEQFQSIKAAPLTQCPQCHKKALKRLIGAGAGLIFKGTGFYITDYKKTGSSAGGGEAKSGGGTKSAGEAKSASPAGGSAASSGSSSGGSTSSGSTPKSPPAKK